MDTPQTIPINVIEVRPGHNPRRTFRPAEFDRLVESIRANGLITPITVRPAPGGRGYELVAGERRLRALKAIGAEDVPALVRELTDDEAARVALLENQDRVDLTPAEEALVAQRHVAAFDGDRAAAAASLGWPERKMEHRLRLLHCAEAVMDALVEGALTLGHAELLATLPETAQLTALPKIVAHGVSVGQLKEQLHGFSIPLSTAVFDKARAGCATCPHNSSIQRGLFTEALGEDERCTNRECFSGLTRAAIDARRAAMREEFGTVVLLTERQAGSTVPLSAFGAHGIGAEALAACRGCSNYGCVIDDRIGPTTGRTESPVCFAPTCNAEKRQAYQESLAAQAVPPADDTQDATEQAAPARKPSASPAKKGAAAATKVPAKGRASAGPATPAPKAVPRDVADAHAGIVRRGALAAMRESPTAMLQVALYALLRITRQETGAKEPLAAVAKAAGVPLGSIKDGAGDDAVLVAMQALAHDAVVGGIAALVTELFDGNADERSARHDGRLNRRAVLAAMAERLSVDFAKHVQIDEAYLTAHTKAGIEHLLDESGFSAWMREQEGGDKRLQKLIAGSKAELVQGVLAAGYPGFAGYVPEALRRHVAESRKLVR